MARRRKRRSTVWKVERQLIRYVYDMPDITRADLARKLGQSPAAISLVIRRLINNGWLREAGRAASLGGRRPVQLRFAKGRSSIVGLDVNPNEVRGVLMDADGSIIASAGEPLAVGSSASAVLKTIMAVANEVAKSNPKGSSMLGVGAGIAGVVSSESGLARFTPHLFGWEPVNIGDELRRNFKDDIVVVDHATSVRLDYEVYTRTVLRRQTVLMLEIGQSIGGAVISNGVVYRGGGGSSLDMGGVRIHYADMDAERIDKLLSKPALLSRVAKLLEDGRPSLLRGMASDPSKLAMDQLATASQAGDQVAFRVISEASDVLGFAAARLTNFFRPDLLLLAGSSVTSGAILMDHVKRQLRLHTHPDVFEMLRVSQSETDEFGAALGAAHLVLRRWLSDLVPSNEPIAAAA